MDKNKEISICLNCPLPDCVANNWGCHLIKDKVIRDKKEREKWSEKTMLELTIIEKLLALYGPLPTVFLSKYGISQNRIYVLKRSKRIEILKVHNGKGGLRVIGVNRETFTT